MLSLRAVRPTRHPRVASTAALPRSTRLQALLLSRRLSSTETATASATTKVRKVESAKNTTQSANKLRMVFSKGAFKHLMAVDPQHKSPTTVKLGDPLLKKRVLAARKKRKPADTFTLHHPEFAKRNFPFLASGDDKPVYSLQTLQALTDLDNRVADYPNHRQYIPYLHAPWRISDLPFYERFLFVHNGPNYIHHPNTHFYWARRALQAERERTNQAARFEAAWGPGWYDMYREATALQQAWYRTLPMVQERDMLRLSINELIRKEGGKNGGLDIGGHSPADRELWTLVNKRRQVHTKLDEWMRNRKKGKLRYWFEEVAARRQATANAGTNAQGGDALGSAPMIEEIQSHKSDMEASRAEKTRETTAEETGAEDSQVQETTETSAQEIGAEHSHVRETTETSAQETAETTAQETGAEDNQVHETTEKNAQKPGAEDIQVQEIAGNSPQSTEEWIIAQETGPGATAWQQWLTAETTTTDKHGSSRWDNQSPRKDVSPQGFAFTSQPSREKLHTNLQKRRHGQSRGIKRRGHRSLRDFAQASSHETTTETTTQDTGGAEDSHVQETTETSAQSTEEWITAQETGPGDTASQQKTAETTTDRQRSSGRDNRSPRKKVSQGFVYTSQHNSYVALGHPPTALARTS